MGAKLKAVFILRKTLVGEPGSPRRRISTQTSNNVPTLENIHWLNHYNAKKLVFLCTWTVWQSVCSALRTLITGMASGSIVAFNIDFNRWHYEHQNRYWGGQHEEEEDGKRREEQEGEEVMHSAVYLRCRGNYRHLEEGKYLPDLRLYSLVYLMWGRGSAGGIYFLHSHACNHRHIISRRYTPKHADKIERLQNGDKEQVIQTL